MERNLGTETEIHENGVPENVHDTESCKGCLEFSANTASDEVFDFLCDPCQNAGDKAEAEGFCVTCDEYLCRMCFKCHQRGKASRNHTLLDKSNMPREHVSTSPIIKHHDDRVTVALCATCGRFICNCNEDNALSKETKGSISVTENRAYVPPYSVSPTESDVSGSDEVKFREIYSYSNDIYIKSENDTKKCYIIGMVLVSNSTLALADIENESLKLVALNQNRVIKTLKFQTYPLGITIISEQLLAVTLPNFREIKLINISNAMSVVKTINTDGRCVAIQFIKGHLFVSFTKPVKFQILKLSGTVLKTIYPSSKVQAYCEVPAQISVQPEKERAYISDWYTDTVLSIDIKGNLLNKCNCVFDGPQDIAISPNGSLYLCDKGRNSIYKLSPDLNEYPSVILNLRDGLESPVALCFNVSEEQLYVSSGSLESFSCNYIKVFDCI